MGYTFHGHVFLSVSAAVITCILNGINLTTSAYWISLFSFVSQLCVLLWLSFCVYFIKIIACLLCFSFNSYINIMLAESLMFILKLRIRFVTYYYCFHCFACIKIKCNVETMIKVN